MAAAAEVRPHECSVLTASLQVTGDADDSRRGRPQLNPT